MPFTEPASVGAFFFKKRAIGPLVEALQIKQIMSPLGLFLFLLVTTVDTFLHCLILALNSSETIFDADWKYLNKEI